MKESARWHRHVGLALALASIVPAGCGRDPDELPTVAAAGTVTYEGKPVSKGTVNFLPEKGRPATGVIDGGKFTLTTYRPGDGAVAGKHKVAVEVVEEVAVKGGDTTAKYLVPQKYAQPEKSGIEIDIPPGGNTSIKIDIK